MRCPYCGSLDTQVKDSRPTEDNSAIRRRRSCPACGSRFTTFERVQLRELIVVKKSGRRVPFDRDKLMRSIEIALRKKTNVPKGWIIDRFGRDTTDPRQMIDGGAQLPNRLERSDIHLAIMPAGHEAFGGRLLYPMHLLAVLPQAHRLAGKGALEIAELADEPLMLMGVGGVTAMGCTIGQGLSGMSTLALNAFTAVAFIVLGAIAAMKYQIWRLERQI